MNTYEYLTKEAGSKPFEPRFIFENSESYSFAQFELKCLQLLRLFKRNKLNKDDRVYVEAERSFEVILLYFACLRYGVIFVPTSHNNGEKEILHILEDVKPKMIFCKSQNETTIKELLLETKNRAKVITIGQDGNLSKRMRFLIPSFKINEIVSRDIACILYTSGTTGKPKGIKISHKSLVLATQTLRDFWNFSRNDILLHSLSLTHGYGLTGVNISIASGSKILFLTTTSISKILEFLPKVSVLMSSPIVYSQLSGSRKLDRELVKNVRLFVSGTALLSKKIFFDFYHRTGKKIIDRYGMTEAFVIACNKIGEELPGSCGRAIPGVELRITDIEGKMVPTNSIGNIEVCSQFLFSGYWKSEGIPEQAFSADGYFKTGDVGRLDENKYLWIMGREGEVIHLRNRKIYPKEIESYIENINGVETAVVIAVPNQQLDLRLIGLVTLVDGDTKPSAKQIFNELKRSIGFNKLPEDVIIVESFPRTLNGKIIRNLLTEQYKNYYKYKQGNDMSLK